jgi:hypothetical protein
MSVQVNEIYYSSWGYNQTNITYYQIVKSTEKSVVLRKIEGMRCQNEDSLASEVMPILNKFDAHYPEPLLKRIQNYFDGNLYFKMSSYEFAFKWDGKPKTETYTG